MLSNPKILITNDDGIHAPGIHHLWNAIKNLGTSTIIAPDTEKSAVGLSITIRNPLRVEPVKTFGNSNAWSVTGTPADCIKMGLSAILPVKPDIVVSGINRGNNAGRNALYSGTVAGVIEATFQGIPGIAFSCHDYTDPNFAEAENYIPTILQYALEHPMPPGTLFNVNFPSKSVGKIKGCKMTRQGKGYWIEAPDKRCHPAEQHDYYWLGAKLATFEEEADCDVTWLEQGYITIVPIHVAELTDRVHLTNRKEHFHEFFNKIH